MSSRNSRDFEQAVAEYIRRIFQQVETSRKARDVGVDMVARDHEGRAWAIQLKHLPRGYLGVSEFKQIADDLTAAREWAGADHSVLIIDGNVSPFAQEAAASKRVSIWDLRHLALLAADASRAAEVAASFATVAEPALPEADELLRRRLVDTPCGHDGWNQYEIVCIDLLNRLFIPPLSPPQVQTRSDDGLDRRDAVYKIGYGHQVWDAIKSECRTRYAVAEFKNVCAAPGQVEVESLQQYLYTDALRSFGLLCARQPPTDSAITARRRAWREFDKMIVFLSDNDFVEMLQIRAAGNDPAVVLDAKIDEFLAALSA